MACLWPPWGATIAANPLPIITGGVATANTVVSAVISTLTETDSYSEINFKISSAPAPGNDSIYLVHRNDSVTTSAFDCVLFASGGAWNIKLWGMVNLVATYSASVPTAITDVDLSQHKLGCSIRTSGVDVIMNAYIDPAPSSTPIAVTHTFAGAAATVPNGLSGFVIYDVTDNIQLDNYKLYSTIPY